MDPNSIVVKLCVAGMTAETMGRPEKAVALYEEAWATAVTPTELCIAAHFLARHQENDQDTLFWHQEALRLADAAEGDNIKNFYPSLYLNLGHSHEALGNEAEARRYYDLAAARADDLPGGQYSKRVRNGIARHRQRMRLVEDKERNDEGQREQV